jgi:ATP-dependent helicase HrpB
MNILPEAFTLPVAAISNAVNEQLDAHNTLIVSAPPGAGKSTLLPLTLLKANFMGDKKILMLEPRRLAAKPLLCAWRRSLAKKWAKPLATG